MYGWQTLGQKRWPTKLTETSFDDCWVWEMRRRRRRLSNKFYFDEKKRRKTRLWSLLLFFLSRNRWSSFHIEFKVSIVVSLIERSIKGIFVCFNDTKTNRICYIFSSCKIGRNNWNKNDNFFFLTTPPKEIVLLFELHHECFACI